MVSPRPRSPNDVSPRSMTTRSMGSPDTQGDAEGDGGDWEIVTSTDVTDWGATSSETGMEETGSHDLAQDGEIGAEYRALKAQVAAQGSPATSQMAMACEANPP